MGLDHLLIMLSCPNDADPAVKAVRHGVHGAWGDGLRVGRSLHIETFFWQEDPSFAWHAGGAQGSVNAVAARAGAVLAFFDRRLGTPWTDPAGREFASGTVAEIELALEAGKPVRVYVTADPPGVSRWEGPADRDQGLRDYLRGLEAGRPLGGQTVKPSIETWDPADPAARVLKDLAFDFDHGLIPLRRLGQTVAKGLPVDAFPLDYQRRAVEDQIGHLWREGETRRIWLHGGGGLGKSMVAWHIAQQAVGEPTAHPTELIVFARDCTPAALVDCYAEVAGDLGIGQEDDRPQTRARALLDRLATAQFRWLVVLDNALRADIADWLPPPSQAGRTLITTTENLGAAAGGGDLYLEMDKAFSPAEAADFVRRQRDGHDRPAAISQEAEADITALAGALDGFPVALRWACSTITAYQMTIAEWLEQFRARANPDEAFDPLDRGYHHENLARIWQVGLARASAGRPAEWRAQLERAATLAALLNPSGHPAWLWQAPPILEWLGQGTAVERKINGQPSVLDALHRVSVVSLSPGRWETAVVSMHRLGAATILARHPADQAALARLLVDTLAHGRAAGQWEPPDRPPVKSGADAELRVQNLVHLVQGFPHLAGGWLDQADQILSFCRPLQRLAVAAEGARAICAAVLAAQPDTATSLAARELLAKYVGLADRSQEALLLHLELAAGYAAKGDAVAAARQELYAATARLHIDQTEPALAQLGDATAAIASLVEQGRADPDLAAEARQRLAHWAYRFDDRHHQATREQQLAVDDLALRHGPGDPRTLLARAVATGYASTNAAEAAAAFADLAAAAEAAGLPNSHPVALRLRRFWAYHLMIHGDDDQAETLWRQVLAGVEDCYGPDSYEYSNAAEDYLKAKEQRGQVGPGEATQCRAIVQAYSDRSGPLNHRTRRARLTLIRILSRLDLAAAIAEIEDMRADLAGLVSLDEELELSGLLAEYTGQQATRRADGGEPRPADQALLAEAVETLRQAVARAEAGGSDNATKYKRQLANWMSHADPAGGVNLRLELLGEALAGFAPHAGQPTTARPRWQAFATVIRECSALVVPLRPFDLGLAIGFQECVLAGWEKLGRRKNADEARASLATLRSAEAEPAPADGGRIDRQAIASALAQVKAIVHAEREAHAAEVRQRRRESLKGLKPGQILKAQVTRVEGYGAFVSVPSLKGAGGLIHSSELSWQRFDHPSDVVALGQAVTVEVLSVDLDGGRVAVSLKATQEDPWLAFARDHPIGQTVAGRVTQLKDFGAFVAVAPGIEGLVHISQLAGHRVEAVPDIVAVGDDVQVRILDIDPGRRRVSLSIRQAAREGESNETSGPEPLAR
jgi:predicted RNA-binding protein with RPS1 domain